MFTSRLYQVLTWMQVTKFSKPSRCYNCSLLPHHTASSGNSFPTFRDNLSVSSSRVKNPKKDKIYPDRPQTTKFTLFAVPITKFTSFAVPITKFTLFAVPITKFTSFAVPITKFTSFAVPISKIYLICGANHEIYLICGANHEMYLICGANHETLKQSIVQNSIPSRAWGWIKQTDGQTDISSLHVLSVPSLPYLPLCLTSRRIKKSPV